LFTTAAVADEVPPPHPRALLHAPPNNMLIVTSLLKPDAAALLPRQHRVRRPTPATALTPLASSPSSRWLRRPHRAGVIVVHGSSREQVLFSPRFLASFLCVAYSARKLRQEDHTTIPSVELQRGPVCRSHKLSSSRQIIFMSPLVLNKYVERVPEF
jgi:hypothetical protein